METYTTNGLVQSLWHSLYDWPWITLIAVVISTFVTTRIITGLQSRPSHSDPGKPQGVRMAPYWFPWIGHGFSIAWNYLGSVEKIRKRMKEPVFGILLCGVEQNVVTSLSMAESILSFPGASSAPAIDHTLEYVFGDRGPIRNLSSASRRELDQNRRNLLMRERNTAEKASPVIRLVRHEIPNLVTFSRSLVDQTPWERASNVTVVSAGNDVLCEANLFALVRHFVGHITTLAFMGQALVDISPGLLDDLRILDENFLTLSMDAHWLPLPGMSPVYAARGRLHQALAFFHDALAAWEDGADLGVRSHDFDDVSEAVKQQARIFKNSGLSGQSSAPGHLSLLWAMNAQTSNIVFWTVLRIFADTTLLEDIRKEIAPYAKASRPTPEETGFPFQEPPRISIDSDGLCSACPLLRACYYEAVRLESAPLSFRKLTSDLTLTGPREDACVAGSTHPRTYQLRKGDNIAIPYGIFHKDARHFSDPDQFDPQRFIQTNETGAKEVYTHTIISSAGSFGCEGSMPAEREILAFTAAILAMWDIKPTCDRGLVIPKHKLASATFFPKKDIRVKLRVRV